jgi:branched-chain amino acid transport system substrate-binding protein
MRLVWSSALALGLALGCRPPQEPIRVGLAGPLTDAVGRPMRLAAEMAVAEINAGGGIDGRPIELIERDDLGDPDSAVKAAADLTRLGVVAVIGHVFSGTTLAAAPVYADAPSPVPVITPSSSAPEISQAGRHVFRLCPTDLEHGAALATWIRSGLGLDRGAVLYLNNPYGRGVRQAFVTRFEAMGGSVIESDPYLGLTPDVAPYLDRIAARGTAQFLVIAGNREDATAILTQVRARGIMLPVLGGDGLEGIEAAADLAEGVFATAAYLPGLETPENQGFVRSYRARYPEAGVPNQPAAASYDAVYLLRDMIKARGATRRDIREALADLGDELPPHQGVTGVLAFDGRGDLARMPVLISVIRNGAVALVERK